ncbi:hypothetical protein C8J56DRAFT_163797 [Mycena floridula]|nr:hypothetical protein C8J56DRAFT_163797 [Mycena floridula]
MQNFGFPKDSMRSINVPERYDSDTARHPPNPHIHILHPRVQARRDESRVVDRTVVWPWFPGSGILAGHTEIIELSLWNSDLLWGHLLPFIVSPPLLIPGCDRLHAVMLFWLHPSKQIRAPLYSMKQSSQRRAIIIKCGIVYLALTPFFILMIALPAAPRTSLHFD